MSESHSKSPVKVATWSELRDREPAYGLVEGADLVVMRYDDAVSVLYGPCGHRDALLADGFIQGDNLVCGVHGWDYRFDSGVSEYNNDERLHGFAAVLDVPADTVWVGAREVADWRKAHPQYFDREEYLGLYQVLHGGPEQPSNARIQKLAEESARRLARFLEATVALMQILARACGHRRLRDFELRDLTTWKRDVAHLTGVAYGGVTPPLAAGERA